LGIWKRGRAIGILGIYVWNSLNSAFGGFIMQKPKRTFCGGTFSGLGPFVAVTFEPSGISSGCVGRPSLAECSAMRCFSPKPLMTGRFVGAPLFLEKWTTSN
jgi:hypothetical protein